MVNTAFCPTCSRTVYLAGGDEPVCPVCSTLLLTESGVPEEHRAADERIGRNEAMFRDVNESIERTAVQRHSAKPAESYEFVCECSRMECGDMIQMTLSEYEEIRHDPHRFLIVTGHDVPGDVPVEERPGYTIVEKVGPPARAAEETYPRETEGR